MISGGGGGGGGGSGGGGGNSGGGGEGGRNSGGEIFSATPDPFACTLAKPHELCHAVNLLCAWKILESLYNLRSTFCQSC